MISGHLDQQKPFPVPDGRSVGMDATVLIWVGLGLDELHEETGRASESPTEGCSGRDCVEHSGRNWNIERRPDSGVEVANSEDVVDYCDVGLNSQSAFDQRFERS